MGLLNKVRDLFRHRPQKKQRSGPPMPRPGIGRRVPRYDDDASKFKKCDKCGRSFSKEKLEHVESVDQNLCKDCRGVLAIYMDDKLP